jgi:hypothetical protein
VSIPDDMALQPNYHALLVAIARELPAEKAFAAIGCYGEMRMVGEPQGGQLSEPAAGEMQEMIEMRESGMTYKEIGEKFGLSAGATRNRIVRCFERM